MYLTKWAKIAGIAGITILMTALLLHFFANPAIEVPESPVLQVSEEAVQKSADAVKGTVIVRQDEVLGASEISLPSPIRPSFDVVRVDPQGNAVIAGRSESGATVTIMDGGKEIGQTQADDRGEWVWLPEENITPGAHSLTLRAQKGEAPALTSLASIAIVVQEPVAEKKALPLVVLLPNGKGGESRTLQKPGEEGLSGDQFFFVDSIDYDERGQLSIGGRGRSGAYVQVYLDNRGIGGVFVLPDGQWRMVPDDTIPGGSYKLRLDHMEDDKVSARLELPFKRAEKVQKTEGMLQIVVQPGNSLWRIARHTLGDGMAYTIIYQANKDQIRDPDLIYPGQILEIPSN